MRVDWFEGMCRLVVVVLVVSTYVMWHVLLQDAVIGYTSLDRLAAAWLLPLVATVFTCLLAGGALVTVMWVSEGFRWRW